ncbi:MAG: matrixin family metalloprotease [Acidobacteriaceae bacterium]|nr:matrixin family metalloprotease [Acidobacteriaceae bacterium]
MTASSVYATQTSNWAGDFAPCANRSELLKHGPMSLGVKFSTSNHAIEREFRKAMDFWASIVDMNWHEDEGSSCAINVVDGTPEILKNAVIARSQFPEWDNFQGWIAFDAHAPLSKFEMYVTAVHEIGHLLGLKHNPDASSIMYFLDLEGPEVVDHQDILSLASRHLLRIPANHEAIPVGKRIPLFQAGAPDDGDAPVRAVASPTALTKKH